MNRLFTLFTILFFSFSAKAQWIDSLVVTPAMPDANDTLRIYAYLTFPQGNCAGVAYGSVVGNDIYGSTLHCMGAAMFICNDVDTLVIPPVMAGTYTLYFTLSSGYGIPNCTPGFQADDEDTLTFQVSTVLDVPTLPEVSARIFPVPASDNLSIQISAGVIEQVEIVSVIGETVLTIAPNQSTSTISTESLQNGMYFCRLIDNEGRIFVQQVEILH
jgi:hypothetical protein